MNKLFNTVNWVPNTDPIGFFFSYYLDFCILFRNDGYFSLSHLMYNYNICCEYSDILEYVRTEFLMKIENDIVYINTGEHTDGVYISWYYLTKILHFFYEHVRNNFTDLTNVNYIYILISNNIKKLEKKINHLWHRRYQNKNIYLITPFELKHTPKLIFTQLSYNSKGNYFPTSETRARNPPLAPSRKFGRWDSAGEFDRSDNPFLRSEIDDFTKECERYKSIKASIVQEQKRLLNLKVDEVPLPKVDEYLRMKWANAPVFVPSNQVLTHPPGFPPKNK